MPAVLYRSPTTAYPTIQSGQGLFLTDQQGKTWLDMSGGAAISSMGHGHPSITNALKDQLDQLAFAHTGFFTHDSQETLANKLADYFAEAGAKIYFTAGGSEANETAFKLAWQYWATLGKPEKKIILSRDHSYHGNTLGALSVSGNPSRRHASGAPLYDWPRMKACYAFRHKPTECSEATYTEQLLASYEAQIQEYGPDTIAGIIIEPIAGASLGVVPPTKGYLEGLRALCDQYDILLIADEVMCGSGRTGEFYAHHRIAGNGCIPDIVTMAKGLGGGYVPLGATLIRAKLNAIFETAGFHHGHSFVGHIMACTAGLAVLRAIEEENLLPHIKNTEHELEASLYSAVGNHKNLGEIRGLGYFWGIEFVSNKATKAGFDNGGSLPSTLHQAAMKHGLICYPGGVTFEEKMVPHILLAPPYIATKRDFRQLRQKLSAIIQETFGE